MKKRADIFTPGQKVSMFGATLLPAALTAGALASWNVRRHAFDDIPTSEKAVRNLARKHLGSNIEVRAVEGLGNAFYTTERDEAGAIKHVITYDPRVNMSVVAHEIGHGLKPIPRVPLSGLIAPALMSSGLFNIGGAAGLGKPIRGRDVGLAALGAALYTPTLLGEYKATSEAKNILGEQPKGLGSAYLTYALPPLLAATYGLGAYGVGRRARGKPILPSFMKTSEAYLLGFIEKCAVAGFDADSLLRQFAANRQTPNIDAAADQPPPVGADEKGTFGKVPGNPTVERAELADANKTLQEATPKLNLGTNVFKNMKPAISGDAATAVKTSQAQGASGNSNTNTVAGQANPMPANTQAAGAAVPKTPMQQTANGSVVAQAVQSLQNQSKAIPGAAALGQTAAGRAVQNGSGILSAFNPAKAVQA
jgi:hypothetical protein